MGVVILGLESSCDETAAAVVEDGRWVRSNIVATQLELHREYGGVVPEIAARRHLELINPVIERALNEAGIDFGDLDAVAVTCGPGLVGGLLVAVSAGKAISWARDIPLVAVNHMEGHIAALFLEHEGLTPPLICLTVSGGHTDLIRMQGFGEYRFLGRTRDDAAGEAFDKVARVLNLGYPGGPAIERWAAQGDPQAIDFPRPYLEGTHDFSFSGLKTAVKYYWEREGADRDSQKADVAASFQQAVVDVLVQKIITAAREEGLRAIAVSGGVACNAHLRSELKRRARGAFEVFFPGSQLCTDNAAMIAAAGYRTYRRGEYFGLGLDVYPNLSLGDRIDGGAQHVGAGGRNRWTVG